VRGAAWTAIWSIRSLEINSSADWGSYIRFTLGSALTFRVVGGARGAKRPPRLTFLISAQTARPGAPRPSPCRRPEVKVDMSLTLDGPLNASDVAFEVGLTDLSAT